MLEAARAQGHCAASTKHPAQGESPLGKNTGTEARGSSCPPVPALGQARRGTESPGHHCQHWGLKRRTQGSGHTVGMMWGSKQGKKRGPAAAGLQAHRGQQRQSSCGTTGHPAGKALRGHPPQHTSTVPHAAPPPNVTQAVTGRRMGPVPCQVTVEKGLRAASCKGRPKRTPAFIYNTPQVTDNRNNKEQGQNSSTTQQRKGNAAPASPAALPNPLVPGRAPQPPPRRLGAQAGKGLLPPLPRSVGGTGMCQLCLDGQRGSAAPPCSEVMAQKQPEPHREGGPKKGPLGRVTVAMAAPAVTLLPAVQASSFHRHRPGKGYQPRSAQQGRHKLLPHRQHQQPPTAASSYRARAAEHGSATLSEHPSGAQGHG